MEGTFQMHNDQRNLETIPTGALGIIPLESCREIGEKVDKYLVIFLLIAVLGIYGTGYESSQFIYNQF